MAQRSYSQNEFIRIQGKLIKWFENYLFKRRQRVINKNSWSSFEPVTAGVPQGSVLGPLMFIIYINDIEEKLISLSRLFADDISLGYSSQSVDQITRGSQEPVSFTWL